METKPLKIGIASCLSSIIEVSLTHPIDTIKVNKQSHNNEILNFKKLYFGFKPRIIGIIPMRMTFWGSQTIYNNYLIMYHNNNNKIINLAVAGSLCGMTQTLIDNPIEVMKIQMMTNKNKFTLNISNIKHISNLYKGFSPTLCRNTIFACIFNIGANYNQINSNYEKFIKSFISGITASIISHPFDYVKTNYQKHNSNIYNKNMFKYMFNIIKTNPITLYTGCFYRCVLSGCTMSIGFIAFTNIYNFISKF